jgi:hypothetical protein
MNNLGASGDTGICGSTFVSNRCKFFPTRIPNLSPVANPVSTFSSDAIAVEMAGHSLYFFAKKNGVVFRDEFQYVTLPALHEIETVVTDESMHLEHPLLAFSKAVQDPTIPTLYSAVSTLANGAEFEVIIDLKPPQQANIGYAVAYSQPLSSSLSCAVVCILCVLDMFSVSLRFVSFCLPGTMPS